MKKKYVKQDGIKDCAVACLYNIIRYYDGNVNMDSLREMLNTSKDGTSIYDIVETSKKLGLESIAYKCEINDICSLDLPVIVHIKVANKYEHYVIIDKIIDDELLIFDPIRGYIKYDMDLFISEWSNIVIVFKKTNNLINEKSTNNIYIKYIKSNIKIISVFILFSIIISFLFLCNSFYLSYLYDNYTNSKKIFLIFIIISILKLILDYYRNILVLNYNKDLDTSLTNKTYNKIISLPLIYHHNRPAGDIIARFNDISSIKNFINSLSFSFIIDLMYIFIISIFILLINKTLFVMLLIMSMIYILLYTIFRENIKQYSMVNKENNSDVNSYLVESIIGIDTIKNMNIEEDMKINFKKKYKNFSCNNIKLNKILVKFNVIQEFICSLTCIIFLSLSITISYKGLFPVSYLFVLNPLISYYFASLKNLIQIDNLIIEAKNSTIRLNDLLKKKNLQKDPINLKFNKKIEFKNLKYSYNNVTNILNNISFDIKKNDFVFIKGPSGEGKSTIFKLLTKQLICEDNMVKIDGIDINEISSIDINNNICYMSQNEFIFTDSILNNIVLYKNVNEDALKKAIEVTGIDKMLNKRNIKLDFLLEEDGHNLSGGERQRILLARSLLRNKKILILDETMNELDIESERELISKIKTEYNITFILISHRYDNSDLFNKIISISGGTNERINN